MYWCCAVWVRDASHLAFQSANEDAVHGSSWMFARVHHELCISGSWQLDRRHCGPGKPNFKWIPPPRGMLMSTSIVNLVIKLSLFNMPHQKSPVPAAKNGPATFDVQPFFDESTIDKDVAASYHLLWKKYIYKKSQFSPYIHLLMAASDLRFFSEIGVSVCETRQSS